MQHLGKKSPMPARKESLPADHDELVELVCRMQKSRFDDQRCDLKGTTDNSTTRGHRTYLIMKGEEEKKTSELLGSVYGNLS